MSEFLFAGEPLPLAPSLEGMEQPQRSELEAFHRKLLEYLKRLGTKLSSDRFNSPSNADIATLALYKASNQSLVSGTFGDIEWDTQIRIDSAYSHDDTDSSTNPTFTFEEDGFYIMFCNIYAQAGTETAVKILDSNDTELIWGPSAQHDPIGDQFIPFSMLVPFHAHKDLALRIQVKLDNNNQVLLKHTRLTIIRIGSISGGGGATSEPCDLQPWQLCPE